MFKVVIEKEIQEEFCFFPNGHQDLREMREFGTYRGYPIGSLLPAHVNTGTRSGRTQQGINVLLNSEDIIKEVEIKISGLIKHLKAQLSEKVFTPRTEAMIEHIKSLLKKTVVKVSF